jgi:D-beta-D-heptose 7-phosphate kinase/D-beta-D-heptose 1-phosphate adenosyltransferase
MSRFRNIIAQFSRKHILVVGDVILDRYIQGNVSRISPEAPVPVVLEEKFFYTPGGAANVSHNISSLGAKVTQVGRVGNDFEGQILKRTLKQKGINTAGIFVDKSVPTITKTRVIAQHQQVVRIDKEKVRPLADAAVKSKIFNFILGHVKDVDAVIISDYGKGMITPEVLALVKSAAAKEKVMVMVDPKVEHFSLYQRVTAITPNLKETENAIRNIKISDGRGTRLKIHKDKLESDEDIALAGRELVKFLDVDSLLITMGERGMRLFEKEKKPVVIKTVAREVFDVSGAGDTVISVFTLALAARASTRKAAELANIAAGIVVGKMGAVAVTKQELLEAH